MKLYTKIKLILIGGGLAGISYVFGNWLAIRDEHSLRLSHDIKKDKEKIAAEGEKIILEKAQLKTDQDKETTKFLANSLNIENNLKSIEKNMTERETIKSAVGFLELSDKINASGGELSEKEKEEFLSNASGDYFKKREYFKEEELSQLKNKLDTDIKEFNTGFAVEKTDTTEEVSSNSTSVSDGNSVNTPPVIRSPLENLEKNLIDIITDIRDNWYSNLNKLQQLCFSLLVLNGVIFACVVNICLSLFGEYLINRFSLETRYPKLSKLIQLRKTFQNFYLKINLLLIIIIVLSEILFSIAVISL